MTCEPPLSPRVLDVTTGAVIAIGTGSAFITTGAVIAMGTGDCFVDAAVFWGVDNTPM